jgi:hypothetical protein
MQVTKGGAETKRLAHVASLFFCFKAEDLFLCGGKKDVWHYLGTI